MENKTHHQPVKASGGEEQEVFASSAVIKSKKPIGRLKILWKKHKKLIIFLILVLAGGGYYFYTTRSLATPAPRYVLGKVGAGDLIVAVSGTGQMSTSNEVSITPKVSAAVVKVVAKQGQTVKAGDPLVQLDNKDLAIALRQAANSVSSAQASLNLKLIGPSPESLKVSQNSVDSAKSALDQSQANLVNVQANTTASLASAKLAMQVAQDQYNSSNGTQGQAVVSAYNNAKATLSSSMIDLRSGLAFADNILGIDNQSLIASGDRYLLGALNSSDINNARAAYQTARNSFNTVDQQYAGMTAAWGQASNADYLKQVLAAAQQIKTLENDVYQLLSDSITSPSLTQATLNSYISSASGNESSAAADVSSLQNAVTSISNINQTAATSLAAAQNTYQQATLSAQQSLAGAQNDLNNKTLAYQSAQDQYAVTVAKPRPIDLASLQNSLAQAQSSYALAKENYDNALVKSPIDGIVAELTANVGSQASAGTALATIVTPDQVAQISLNEVDAAKAKVGQKATLTFTAIDGLTVSGTVIGVDLLGVANQGVVNYTVKIALDNNNDQIKPNMSVSANIVVNQHLGVLTVPSAAIKTDSQGNSYVLTLPNLTNPEQTAYTTGVTSPTAPQQTYVQVGLSDNTNTEITGGLTADQLIIVSTITTGATTKTGTTGSTGSNPNALRALTGGGGFGGGAGRGN